MNFRHRGAAAPARRRLSHEVNLQAAGLAMVVPAILLMCVLLVAPFVVAMRWSLVEETTGALSVASYQWLFRSAAREALGKSLYVAVGSVALELLVAIPLAILLNQKLPGRGFLRAAVTLPWAIPTICVGTALTWLTNVQYGLLNQVALATGLVHRGFSLFGSPLTALPAITAVHAWKGLPIVFVIILTSLQSLPSEHLEAAKVDGAWRLAQFRRIILPHLMPSIILAAVVSGIYNFSLFDITYVLTGGGPAAATTTLPLMLYNQYFRAFNPGRAAVIGITIFLACMITLLCFSFYSARLAKRSGG